MLRPTEIAHLRDTLEIRRAEIEDLLIKREPAFTTIGADMLDQIQRAQESEIDIEILQGESDCLAEVRAALRRIYGNTYGNCLECNEQISPKRLAAVPWASNCISCAEMLDHRYNRPDSSSFESSLIGAF